MKPYLTNIEFHQETQTWTISGTCSLKIDEIQAHYTEMFEFLRPEKKVNLSFETNGNTFTATIQCPK